MKDLIFKAVAIVLMFAAVIVMQGCSTLTTIAAKGADLNDQSLKASEFTICSGASVGAVIRRYNTPELMDAWRKLCVGQNSQVPMSGDNE